MTRARQALTSGVSSRPEPANRTRGGALALAAIALATLLLAACQRAADPFVDVRLLAMATTVELRLPREPGDNIEPLIAMVEAELEAFGHDYYAWGDGELAALNAALNAGRSFTATAGMAALLLASQDIARATDGRFDPGVGRLVELWGLHDGTALPQTQPAAAAIANRLATSASVLDLTIDTGTITLDSERRITLDLGGIAKGAAVDKLATLLAAQGIGSAMINAGGDLRVIGTPPGRNWRIGVQAPRDSGLVGTIELKAGEAAFSSGDYERYFEADGTRFHHILDPRSGYPVSHTRAITVIAATGTRADAAATALFVAGPGNWQALADKLGIDAVLRIDASGAIEMTPPMRDRFEPGTAAGSDILITGN